MRRIAALGLALSLSTPIAAMAFPPTFSHRTSAIPGEALIGRWDITVNGSNGRTRPAWFEVKLSGNRSLVGAFVSSGGSARPVSKVTFTGNGFRFAIPPQWEQGDGDLVVEGTLADGKVSGTITEPNGRSAPFTGVRAPELVRTGEPTWGEAIELFNGRDLGGWKPSMGTSQWQVVNGLLTNTKNGANLITERTFSDFRLHVEFRVPKDGNSGIYLRGRHEVQVEDSHGMEPLSTHTGGVYGFLTPNQNAALPAGEWQTYDITLVGRLVTVVLNGKTVISMQNIPGITGGALDSNEGEPGPIYLQGDHTAVEFRKIVLTPAR
ncbi:MAG TPA: DUF1080 domain-containing protein [Gemmatimonadaceae bacterium]|nr:DUF1080 domain-containing protein [Gemmatimonadaceae bacterium]